MNFLLILLSAAAIASPVPSLTIAKRSSTPSCTDFCGGDNIRFNRSLLGVYVCGDARLGPSTLPKHPAIAKLLIDYSPFAGLCPDDFLTKYTDAKGDYKYPDDQGYLIDIANKSIKSIVTLKAGWRVDRFGNEDGIFLSPFGAPYSQRAIPPETLNTKNETYVDCLALRQTRSLIRILSRFPADYHVYEVIRDFDVQAGPILPAFGQPGQGVQ